MNSVNMMVPLEMSDWEENQIFIWQRSKWCSDESNWSFILTPTIPDTSFLNWSLFLFSGTSFPSKHMASKAWKQHFCVKLISMSVWYTMPQLHPPLNRRILPPLAKRKHILNLGFWPAKSPMRCMTKRKEKGARTGLTS